MVEVGLDPGLQHFPVSLFSFLLSEGIFLLLVRQLGVLGERDPSGLPLGFKSITAWTGSCCGVPGHWGLTRLRGLEQCGLS